MPTLDEIQTAVNNGKLFAIKKMPAQLRKFRDGGCGDLEVFIKLKRVIRALQFQIIAEDDGDLTFSLYKCLLSIIGNYGATYTLDPSVSIPGMVVSTVNVIVGWNDNKIPFTSTEENPGILLDDYHAVYWPLYGNNPDLALYNNSGARFEGDEQTPPNITYVDNDPTKDIVSILFDRAPLPGITITGYVRISGVSPFAGSAQGGSTIAPPLTFTQGSLLLDSTDPDNPVWYLPLSVQANQNVVMVKSNNKTVVGWIYNTDDYSPGRIYGFANNSAQTIKVQII